MATATVLINALSDFLFIHRRVFWDYFTLHRPGRGKFRFLKMLVGSLNRQGSPIKSFTRITAKNVFRSS